jgi:hypothetical protein
MTNAKSQISPKSYTNTYSRSLYKPRSHQELAKKKRKNVSSCHPPPSGHTYDQRPEKKHDANTRLEYSNERHGRERNERMMRMTSPVYDGWRIIDGMCTARSVHLSIAQYRESEVYVARTFDPEYIIVETGMGTPGTGDQCSLDSSVTVLVSTRWAGFIRRKSSRYV